jgi:hypothetical protein
MTGQEFKGLLLNDWNAIRLIRVGMGAIALYQAITVQDVLVGVLALVLLVQGIMNWSCCGMSSCVPKQSKKNASQDKQKEVIYEELN